MLPSALRHTNGRVPVATEELMSLTPEEKSKKLQELVDSEGHPDLASLLQACIADSVSPGICTKPDCNYTTEIEPDQRRGYCEACGGQTVQSALVLAGII